MGRNKILSYIEEIRENPYEVSGGNLKRLVGPLRQRSRLKLDKGGRFIYRLDPDNKKISLESCNNDHYKSFRKAVENGSADGRKEIELDQAKLEEWKKEIKKWRDKGKETQQEKERTELQEVVLRGIIEEVKKLINKENANAENKKNRKTLLMYAAENGRFDVLQHLIENEGDVNKQDDDKKSVLMYALDGIERIEDAEESGRIIDLLLKQGVDVNAKDNSGITALMIATQYGQYENVKKLIEKKAEINAQNINGNTALMFAVEGGSRKIVTYLLQKGADVNITNAKKQTAEMLAQDILKKIKGKQSSEAKDLINGIIRSLKKKAKSTKSNADEGSINDLSSQSDLEIVLENDTEEVVYDNKENLLLDELEATIVLDSEELRDDTWFADVRDGDEEELRAYIDAGFDINTVDEQGKTALMYAAESSNKIAIERLLQLGADINKQDNAGKTALMYAVENKLESIVTVLLRNNPNIDITNKKGKTVIDMAKNWPNGLGVLKSYKKRLQKTESWQAEEREKNRLFESIESGVWDRIKNRL